MMAAPAVGKSPSGEQPRNLHAGAASAGTVEKPTPAEPPRPKEPLDETAELFRSIFKGEIVP